MASVVISRPWSRDSSYALEFILSRSRSRSRSRYLMAQVSVLVSRPEVQGLGLQDIMLGAKACCNLYSTVERLLCHQLVCSQWCDLETMVSDSSAFEFILSRSRGLRFRSRDLKKVLTTTLIIAQPGQYWFLYWNMSTKISCASIIT